VPGLAFRTRSGDWIDVPTVPDAFIVNGGQLLLRWTNDRFLATPHRAVNRTGGERYALAFFCDAQIDVLILIFVKMTIGSARWRRKALSPHSARSHRKPGLTYFACW
jgi:isopenicillin N synthase-like dioxygenase